MADGASTVISSSFRDTAAPGWVFSGTGTNNLGVTNKAFLTAATGIDASGMGWLRLTDTNGYLTGLALNTNTIPSTNSSIFTSLDMAIWGGYADGFVLFFYDASVPFSIGASGGSLGYAQSATSGMGGGYLGLGVDEFGNYSNPNQGRIGGPGQIGNAIAVRGPGSLMSGYKYIAGTGDGITPRLGSLYYFPTYKTRPTNSVDARHLEALLSPNNQLTVYLKSGTNAQSLCFVADLSKYARPNNLKMGFTASTGGAMSFHELQNVTIAANIGMLWDNQSGDRLWSSASNWNPDGVPAAGSEIIFNNTYVQTNQTIDLGGATRTVRGISFDADFAYTLTNGIIYFSTNADSVGRLVISQSGINGNGNMTIDANLQTSDDLTVDNAALGSLSLNGNLDNQGHTLYFAGAGVENMNGVISGSGLIVNYRSILTLSSNTYTGGTLLQNGTTILASDRAFGSGTVSFTGGTLQAANGLRTITNSIWLQGSSVTIGGSTPLTFTGTWWSRLNATLTINNTALTRFSGGIALAENNLLNTLTLNVGTTALVDSVITNGPGSGADSLTKAGLGTLSLTASNGYTGLTTVSGGVLALGASERLNDVSTLSLAGGTINLGGFSETVSGLGYTNGAIDFGTNAGANYLMFTTNLPASGSLVILNFQAGVDHLAFRDTNAVPDTFVSGVYFSGYGVGGTVTAGGQTIPGYSGTWKFIEPAAGQNVWNGASAADNFWSSPANWVGNVQPSSGSGVNIFFDGSTRLTPDLDNNRTVGMLQFTTNAGAFTLMSSSGSTLTVDGTVPGISQESAQNQIIGLPLTLAAGTLFDIVGPGSLTVTGSISGAGGITKLSAGELSLTGSNSYAGANVFNNGLVNIRNNSALGATNAGTSVLGTATLELAGNINIGAEPLLLNSPGYRNEGAICNEWGTNCHAGLITLAGPSRINADGGSLTVLGNIATNALGNWDLTAGGNGDLVFSNVLATGGGALTKDGTGTLTLKGTAANTSAGITTVLGGLLILQKNTGVTAVNGNLQIGDGSTNATVRLLAREQINDSANVTIADSGLLDLNGFNETIANLNASGSLASVQLGTGTLTVNGFDNSTFNGVISGSGAMVKTNAGTLDLTGPNTYLGVTTVGGGVLRIENSTALGNNAAAVTVFSGAALELKDGIAVGAKPLNISGSGISGTGGGALRNIAGDNSWAGNIALTGPTIISSDSGRLALTGSISGVQPLQLGGAVGTIQISGPIAIGAAALTVNSGGIAVLSGTNTYGGATLINAGTLALSAFGSISNTALISVAGGATLDVSGLTNNFALQSSQTLSNGAAATGTLKGSLSTGSGAVSLSYISGTPALMVTGGALTLAAGTVCKINNAGSALAPGSYKIISAGTAGLVDGAAPSSVTVTGGGVAPGASASLQITGHELNLLVSLIPTATSLSTGSNPSTYGAGVNFTATVKTNGVLVGNASGSYVFKVDGVPSATISVTGGSAACTLANLSAATHALAAEYTGDATYAPSTNALTQTVNPAMVSITSGLTANQKIYDGTAAATITSNNVVLAGVLAGDAANVALSTNGYAAVFASASVGTNKVVTVSGLALSGSAAGNYTVAQPTLTANIVPGSISRYVVSVSAPTYAKHAFTTYATAKDAYGNTVTTDSSTKVTFSSISANMMWDGNGIGDYDHSEPAEITATLVNGVAAIPTMDNYEELNVTITATDTHGETGTSAPFNIMDQTGACRSAGSGLWSSASTWQTYNGTAWVAATSIPVSGEGCPPITIQPGHAVTLDMNISEDELLIESNAQFIVNSASTLTIHNNDSYVGLELRGMLVNHGAVVCDNNSASVVYDTGVFQNAGTVTSTADTLKFYGGKYQHSQEGGSIPAASWLENSYESVCEIIGYTNGTTPPNGLNQAFETFIWNCPSQTGQVNLGTGFTSADKLVISNTHSGAILLGADFTTTTSATVNSGAAIFCSGHVISGGDFILEDGGNLGIGSPAGITASGLTGNIQTTNRNFSPGGNYIYTGTTAQSTGDGLPATINSLTDNNTGGTLTLAQVTIVTSGVTLAGGAKLNLPEGTSSAATLSLGGIVKTAGTWGSTSSSATHPNDTYFSGNGVLNITTGQPPAFSGLTASPTIIHGTTSITLAGRVSAGSVYPASGETITVTINGHSQTTTINDGAGDFSFSFNPASIPASAGAYAITYAYAGNENLNAATDTSTALTVNRQTPAVATPPAAGAITCGQTLGDSSLTGGTVTNAAAVTLNGTFVFTTPSLTPGAGTSAQGVTFLPADAINYNRATAAVNVTVNPAATAVSVSSTSQTNGYRDGVTFTAFLPASATGEVTFKTNNVTLSASNLVSGMAGSLTITNLPRGTNLITAEYAGDSNFLGSTNTLNQVVTNHPPVVTTTSYTRTAGLKLRIFFADLTNHWIDADGDPVTLDGFNLVTYNNVNLVTNSSQALYPASSQNVNDQITYTIRDGQGGTSTGIINVVVNPFVTGQQTPTAFSISNNVITAIFYGMPDYVYQVQRSTNLNIGSGWVDIATNTVGTNGLIQVTDPFPDLDGQLPASAYYRLKWHP